MRLIREGVPHSLFLAEFWWGRKEQVGRENIPYRSDARSYIVTQPCVGFSNSEICLIQEKVFLGVR